MADYRMMNNYAQELEEKIRRQLSNYDYIIKRFNERLITSNKEITEYCNIIADYVADEMGHYLILNTCFQNEIVLLQKDIEILQAREKAVTSLNWFERLSQKKIKEAMEKAENNIVEKYKPILKNMITSSQETQNIVMKNLKKN